MIKIIGPIFRLLWMLGALVASFVYFSQGQIPEATYFILFFMACSVSDIPLAIQRAVREEERLKGLMKHADDIEKQLREHAKRWDRVMGRLNGGAARAGEK